MGAHTAAFRRKPGALKDSRNRLRRRTQGSGTDGHRRRGRRAPGQCVTQCAVRGALVHRESRPRPGAGPASPRSRPAGARVRLQVFRVFASPGTQPGFSSASRRAHRVVILIPSRAFAQCRQDCTKNYSQSTALHTTPVVPARMRMVFGARCLVRSGRVRSCVCCCYIDS